MSLSIIDFSDNTDHAAAIDDSFTQLGFMQIKNYGIDTALLREVFRLSRDFFKSDDRVKRRCRYRSAEENFGYQGLLEENLDPTAPADVKETFTMRNIINQCPEDERWPSDNFRRTMQDFYKNALQASFTVMREIARNLKVDEEFFVDCHKGENISLRILYYPAQQFGKFRESNQLGAGAHTDYGFITQLFQEDVGGLQVFNRQKKWLDVEPLKNTTVINSGDLLERWTNGRYRSTLHRVNIKNTQSDRLSIAFFLDPDSDTWVEPLPSCTQGVPTRFTATSAGEHILEKLQASHKSRFVK